MKRAQSLPIIFTGRSHVEIDFLFEESCLVIELDGGQHFADRDAYRRDREKGLVVAGERIPHVAISRRGCRCPIGRSSRRDSSCADSFEQATLIERARCSGGFQLAEINATGRIHVRQPYRRLSRNELDEIGTQEAADMLGVSRPFLVKLLDSGAIPSRKVGVQRRLRATDVVAYQKRERDARRKVLAELAREGQQLGLGE